MAAFLAYTWDLLMKSGLAAVGFLRGLNAASNGGLTLLLFLMVADYITGIVAAAMGKSRKTAHGGLSSAAGAKGLLRKALILLVVLLSAMLDRFINQGNAMFQTAVTWFYISNEAISLLENLARCGVPVPAKIRTMLEQIRSEEDAAPAPADLLQQVPPKPAEIAIQDIESPQLTENIENLASESPSEPTADVRPVFTLTRNRQSLRAPVRRV